MSSLLSRRAFLRGRVEGEQSPGIRPPWALEETAFKAACDGCGACLWSCPQNILVRGEDGLPQIDFAKGACDFCGDCVKSCDRKALLRSDERPALAVKAVAGASCISSQGVACRVCGDFCEPMAIRFPPSLGGSVHPQINLSACTGCGACVAPCPVGAIEMRA